MAPSTAFSNSTQILSLEDWMQNPPQGQEWVSGRLVDKHPSLWLDGQPLDNGMTLKHSRIQAKLATYWRNYQDERQGGEVYTDVPCRTNQQGRSPDVAYLPPALVAQYGDAKVLPQSFPLSAEIVSPTDFAEEVIAKAEEYLQSGGEEVWLVFPENRWVIVVTQESRQVFAAGERISTQKVLPGFNISVDELFA